MFLLERFRFFGRKFRLGFRPGDLVLDVGSGNDPHPRADILCDKFVRDDFEREGRLVIDRPLVGGDLEALPFRDKSIDFVIASHVLEHVIDPGRAIDELMRVAKAGYIETPSEFGGKLLDLPGHRWYVRLDGETLVFSPKYQGMYDDHLNAVSFGLWQTQDRSFKAFFWQHPELFFVQHKWSGKLDYRITPATGAVFQPEDFVHANLEEAALVKTEDRSLKQRAKNAIRDYFHSSWYGPSRKVDLAALCACPTCHAGLEFGAETCTCTGCRAVYPLLLQGETRVPMLIPALASHPADRAIEERPR